MSEQSIMVCIQVSDSKEGNVAEGSVISNCSECDAPIWMSVASQVQMAEQEGIPVCTRCFKPPEDATFVPPTREVIKEILDHLMKGIKQDEKPTDRVRDATRKRR